MWFGHSGTNDASAAINRGTAWLDCGPMSGFDHAKVDEAFFAASRDCVGCDEEFFPEGHVRSNFLCNLGYGDPAKLHARNPRPDFDEACVLL